MGRLLILLAALTLPNPSIAQDRDMLADELDRFAAAHFDRIQPRSITDGVEYCGLLGVDADGNLAATPARRGDADSCRPDEEPDGFEVLASYHTHGAYDRDADTEVPSLDDLVSDIDEGIDDDSGNGWDVTVMSESQARDSAAKSKKMRRNKAQEQRNIEKLHQDRQSVLSAVEAHPDGETRTVLRKKAGLNNERFNEALELLLEEGAVVDGGEITKANRRKYPSFKLNGTQKNDDE